MELDLTEAIEAAARAMYEATDSHALQPVPIPWLASEDQGMYRDWVRSSVEAAAPIIERQVRADAIREIAERCFYDEVTDQPLPHYYELLDEADRIARGER